MPAEEANSPGYFYRAIAHELGHNFGVQHSNTLDYGVETLGPAGFKGLSTEYGDTFVTMAATLPGHYVAQHKVLFGWLASGTGYKSVSASGSYTLEPYGTATGGLKALKVARGTGGTSYLWVEYRQPTDPYETDMGTQSSSIYSGAYIHYDDGSGSLWTYLLSFTPSSANKFVTPVLAAGSSWADPYSDLVIQVGAATSAGLPITVSYGNKAGCATTISPATVQPAATGGAATANVTAPSSCAWTATSNVPWITITGSASGTGNGTINYTVAANSLSQARFGRITAGGMSLGVVQAEAPGSITAIAANTINFPASGGAGQLAVTVSTTDYAWSVPFDWDWVQFTSAGSTGSGTLIYVVGENTGPARSVTIPVGNFNYVINQAGGTPASSQMDWLQLDVSGATPSPRFSEGVAYFGPTGETILYGGITDTTYYGDTWGWNGSGWTQKSPAHNPGTRVGHVMLYDPVRQQIVMFGGYSPSSPYQLNDTWVWNGTDWTQLQPAHSPPIRANAAAVFDTVNQVVVMFGGTNYQGELNDTWVWNGTDWTQKFPLTSPPARDSQAMAYDPVRQQTVMFGGAESPQTVQSQRHLVSGHLDLGRFELALTEHRGAPDLPQRSGHGLRSGSRPHSDVRRHVHADPHDHELSVLFPGGHVDVERRHLAAVVPHDHTRRRMDLPDDLGHHAQPAHHVRGRRLDLQEPRPENLDRDSGRRDHFGESGLDQCPGDGRQRPDHHTGDRGLECHHNGQLDHRKFGTRHRLRRGLLLRGG